MSGLILRMVMVRVFDNNLKSECCCYYAGIERIEGDIKYINVGEQKQDGSSQRKRKALSKGRG